MTTDSMCMICGASFRDGEDATHRESERCQRATAQLSVDIADGRLLGRKMCPWCAGKRGLLALSQCTNTEHAAKLAYCRQLLAAAVSPAR